MMFLNSFNLGHCRALRNDDCAIKTKAHNLAISRECSAKCNEGMNWDVECLSGINSEHRGQMKANHFIALCVFVQHGSLLRRTFSPNWKWKLVNFNHVIRSTRANARQHCGLRWTWRAKIRSSSSQSLWTSSMPRWIPPPTRTERHITYT